MCRGVMEALRDARGPREAALLHQSRADRRGAAPHRPVARCAASSSSTDCVSIGTGGIDITVGARPRTSRASFRRDWRDEVAVDAGFQRWHGARVIHYRKRMLIS